MIKEGGVLVLTYRIDCRFRHQRRRGFTLVELLIVMVIIAVLAGAAFVEYGAAKVKSRNARRIVDINSIASALTMYYTDQRDYPEISGGGTACSSPTYQGEEATPVACWSGLATSLSLYVPFLPAPPKAKYIGTEKIETCKRAEQSASYQYKIKIDASRVTEYKILGYLEGRNGSACPNEADDGGSIGQDAFEVFSAGGSNL